MAQVQLSTSSSRQSKWCTTSCCITSHDRTMKQPKELLWFSCAILQPWAHDLVQPTFGVQINHNNKTVGPVRFAEKTSRNTVSDDLLWEKKTIPAKKTSWKIRIIRQANRASENLNKTVMLGSVFLHLQYTLLVETMITLFWAGFFSEQIIFFLSQQIIIDVSVN